MFFAAQTRCFFVFCKAQSSVSFLMNFLTNSVSTSNDWRKRRKFMDIARPFVERLVGKKDVVVYEDALFLELGLKEAELASLKAFLESSLKVVYEQILFAGCDSLVKVFELSLTLPSFLPELEQDLRGQSSFATIGVPLWLAESSLFVLREGISDGVELKYETRPGAFGKDVITFTSITVNASKDTTETLMAFAFSEIVRRDGRIGVGKVSQCAAFLSDNPGWMPYVA